MGRHQSKPARCIKRAMSLDSGQKTIFKKKVDILTEHQSITYIFMIYLQWAKLTKNWFTP